MPRRPKIGQCAYCGREGELTRDHVIARTFFPKEDNFRANLPRVPACRECNNLKSDFENRLPVLLQFSGPSQASKIMFESGYIQRLLNGNRRLHESLNSNFSEVDVITQSGGVRKAGIIRLDKNTVSEMSKWLKMVSQAIYFLKYEKISGDWEMFSINSVGIDQVKYFDGLIISTGESITMGNSSRAWSLKGAFSEDGVMLFRIEFNSIIQFVVAIHKTKTSLISQYAAVGY